MPEIRLPLSALERADFGGLSQRIVAFQAHHGHPPGESSTWAEWCAVTPAVGGRLGDVIYALPWVYPARRVALRRVVVEVAYRAAVRRQPAAPDPRVTAALALVRRWLDGEPISVADLRSVVTDLRDTAHAVIIIRTVFAAYFAAYAAAYAAYAAADGDMIALDEAADIAIDRGDLVRQLEDLDELLAGLNLEVRSG